MRMPMILLAGAAALVAGCNNPADNGGNAAGDANATAAEGGVTGGNAPAGVDGNAAAARGEQVAFRGCPIRVDLGGGCITVKSDNGVTYELYSSGPLPDPGRRLIVEGTGTPGGASTCMAGTVLNNVKWQYTKAKCADDGKE